MGLDYENILDGARETFARLRSLINGLDAIIAF
jgi:hypothetical protein